MRLIRCEIASLNLGRLFTAFDAEGVRVTEIVSHGKTTAFCVPRKHYEKMMEICRRLCYTIRIYGEAGAIGALRKLFARGGLIAGTLAGLVVAVFAYSRVWTLRVEFGADNLPAVETALSECGVSRGMAKSSLDLGAVAAALERLDGVAGVEVQLKGCTLVVRLASETSAAPPVNAETGSVVRARYDCRITKITVIAGTPCVEVGDVVLAGEPLVEGREGEGDDYRSVVPRAVIYGEVWFVASREFLPERTEYRRTGEFRRTTELTFGSRVLWSDGDGNPYAHSETEERVIEVARGVLPITFTERIRYETEPYAVTADFETERPALEADALAEAGAKVRGDCTVLEAYSYATRLRDRIRVTGVIRTAAVVST